MQIESLGSAHSERLKPTQLQQLQGKSSLDHVTKSVISQLRYCNATCESRIHIKRMPHSASPIEQHCNTSRLFATVRLNRRTGTLVSGRR
jgi:hypothetical protein